MFADFCAHMITQKYRTIYKSLAPYKPINTGKSEYERSVCAKK